jgi:hypothetical protein
MAGIDAFTEAADAMLARPGQLALLRADAERLPRPVEEIL